MVALFVTSATVLFLACASFLIYEILTLRKGMVQGYLTRAQIIAANSTAALAFQNEKDAAEVLSALKTDRRVVAACLYDDEGGVFARYPAETKLESFPTPLGSSRYKDGYLETFCPVVHDGRTLGIVFIRSDLSALTDRYRDYVWLVALTFLGSILAAFPLARILQEQISRPILALSGAARSISEHLDFSARAEKFGEDELGVLTDAFNRMLETLAERTRLLDMVMRNMSEGVVVADRTGKMVYFNQGAERITGMTISAKPSDQWIKEYGVFKEDKVTPWPQEEMSLGKAVRGIEENGVIQFLRNPAHPEGIFISVNGRPLKDEKGRPAGGMVVFRDITQELKVREELKASEVNYREIFEKVNDALYVHEMDTGRIVDVNDRTCEMMGFSREEILHGDPNVAVTGKPGYALKDAAEWIKKAATQGPQIFEWLAKHKSGREYWVEVSLKRAVIAGQDRVLALVRDISDRKRMEEALQSQGFISSILENLPNMVFVKDAKELKFVMFNKAGEDLLGIPRQDLMGKNDFDFFPQKEAEHFTAKDRKTLEAGKVLDIPEEPLSTKGKGLRTLHTKKIPVMGPDGKPAYLLGISEDITDQKKQEEMRIYTKALENSNKEMQDFIFVASHDLQEPLRKVQAFGNFLKEELGGGISAAAVDYLTRMQDAALRMGRLIEDLLQLTRVTTRAKPFERIALKQVLEDVLSDLEIRLKETGGRVVAGDLPTLDADPTQMRQLFQNLLGNALKFHKKGEVPVVEITAEASQGSCLIRVKDNGIGFDPKYNQKIFEIFQRLNGQEYEGTGIGLAVCRKVVERHGGKITVASAPGQGAVFEVVLPLEQDRKEGKNGS
jgi:PAS domain S-box-containing protein